MIVRFRVSLRRLEEGLGFEDNLVNFTTSIKSCVDPPFNLASGSRTKRLMKEAKYNRDELAADY